MFGRSRLSALVIWLVLVAAVAPAVWATPQADSVILFIGDGMGPNHVVMAGGALGHPLVMATAPYRGTATTLASNGEITDSASASTALATGHKTLRRMLSISPEGKRLPTILELAQRQGKATGVVTTDVLWGATPAGFYAHVPQRSESAEIVRQAASSGMQVMLGMGVASMFTAGPDGEQKEGPDLLAKLRGDGYEVVTSRHELLTAQSPRLLGLFDASPRRPRVRDMVLAAISRLATNPRGFLLVVEHCKLDWEPGDAPALVSDALQLDEGVAAAVDFAKARGRTLVVVTGDHETGKLGIADPERLPMLLKMDWSAAEMATRLNADRGNVAQVMTKMAGITDLTAGETEEITRAPEPAAAIGDVISARAGLAWASKGHTDTPVPVFAFGAGARHFSGAMDNTDIPKRIARILGLGSLAGSQPAQGSEAMR